MRATEDTRPSARELVSLLLDDAVDLPTPDVGVPDPLGWPGYRATIERHRPGEAVDESILVTRGRIAQSDVEVVAAVWEFAVLGGSMGVAAGQRIAMAYDHAREHGLPVLLVTATGGARMQEGMSALVQMAATTVAATNHAQAGLLQVAMLLDPTTGGVLASHVNLADVIVASPGATVGFAGPRVAQQVTSEPLPAGSHTAEGAVAAGLVDAVVPLDEAAPVLAGLLAWPRSVAEGVRAAPRVQPAAVGDPWVEVRRARDGARPRAQAYLDALDVAFELRGDRAGVLDPAVRVALCRLGGEPVVVVALDRDGNGGRVRSGGYRAAWRGLRLAGRVGVPVVTLVDTPGADPSAESEAGGIAAHIARTFAELLAVPTPTVALVVGEGGSGGALALAVTDRLLIQEHAIFSVIAPEGAAAILHRDPTRAPEVAALLKPRSTDLLAAGIADAVIAEPEGAQVATALDALASHLDELRRQPSDDRLRRRLARWRHAGVPA